MRQPECTAAPAAVVGTYHCPTMGNWPQHASHPGGRHSDVMRRVKHQAITVNCSGEDTGVSGRRRPTALHVCVYGRGASLDVGWLGGRLRPVMFRTDCEACVASVVRLVSGVGLSE